MAMLGTTRWVKHVKVFEYGYFSTRLTTTLEQLELFAVFID